MKENIVIELSNGIKFIVIDVITLHKEQYFLMSQTTTNETGMSDEFEIYKYDRLHNNFDHIEYDDEYQYIKGLFDERLKKQKLEFNIISKIDFDELIKLEVTSVKKYDYKLKHNDTIIKKNIEFYSNTKPKVGDYIYVSRLTLNDDMLTYGHIKFLEEINHNNILVIERDNQRIYLRRYYG